MTKSYVTPSGLYLMSFDGDVPPPQPDAVEVPSTPENSRQIWDFVAEEWGPVPEPEPVQIEPTRIACALRVPVIADEVQQIGGAYRVMAILLMDTGIFLTLFSENLGSEPYVIPNNGISVEISEWGGDYAMIEVRDHAGGALVTPASFGFSLYQL